MAEEIAIDTVLIPPFPGALSALGAARADLEGDLVQPVYERLGDLSAATLADGCRALQERAQQWLAEQTASLAVTDTRIEIAAEMRYDGQGYDVTVPVAAHWLLDGEFDRLRAAFHQAHRATYGHANEAAEIWLKELRVHIVGATPKPRIAALHSGGGGPAAARRFRLFGREFSAVVYERAGLRPGRRLSGPAIVDQMDTTTLIPQGWEAHTLSSGALGLERTLKAVPK